MLSHARLQLLFSAAGSNRQGCQPASDKLVSFDGIRPIPAANNVRIPISCGITTMARNSNQSSNNTEPESENTAESGQTRKLGFKADVLTRIAAVAVFVVIGSFAVVHSLRKPDNHDHSEHAEGAVEPDSAEAASLNAVGDSESKLPTDNAAQIASDADAESTIAGESKDNPKPDEYVEFGNVAALGLDSVAKLVKAPPTNKTDFGAMKVTTPKADVRASFQPGSQPTAPPIPSTKSPNTKLAADSKPPQIPSGFDTGKPTGGFQSPDKQSKPVLPNQSNSLTAKAKPIGTPKVDSLLPPLPKTDAQLNNGATKPAGPPPNRFASANPSILGRGDAKLNPSKPLNAQQDKDNNGFESPAISSTPFDPLAKAKERTSNALNNLQEFPVVDRAKELGQQGAEKLKQAGRKIGDLAESGFDQVKSFADGGRRMVEQPARDNNSFGGLNVDRSLTANQPPGAQQVVTGTTAPNALRSRSNNPPPPNNLSSAPPIPAPNNRSFGDPAGNNQPTQADKGPNGLVRSKAPAIPAGLGSTRPTPRNSQVPVIPVGSSSGGFPPATNTSAAPPRTRTPLATQNTPGTPDLDGLRMPALAIERRSPPEVQVNQTAEFILVVKNMGRVAVDNVQVYDRVPAGAKLDGATPQPESNANGQLQWNLGTMKPGEEQRIALNLTPTQPGELGSVAQVTFASRSSLRTKVTQPILEVVHRTQPKVLVGDKVVFDVTVSNKGDGPARNVVIQEDVPQQLIFQEGYREIEYDVGTLPPGQSRNVRLQLQAKQAGRLKNVMFASAAGGLKAKHELDLEVVAPTLKVKSEGPVRRFLGRNVTHQISLDNKGTATATNIDLVARLPRGLRFVSANNQGRYVPSAHAVFWNLAQLPVGANAGVELNTTPIAVGNHPIKIESTADLGLKDETEQPFSIEHLVDVFFDIDDVVDPIEIGSETRYRIEIVNQGSKTATNVQLQVEFPNGLKPTEVAGPLQNQIRGQSIQFEPIASLQPGQKINLVLTGLGQASGDHRVSVTLKTSDRQTPVVKEETTRVYSDR